MEETIYPTPGETREVRLMRLSVAPVLEISLCQCLLDLADRQQMSKHITECVRESLSTAVIVDAMEPGQGESHDVLHSSDSRTSMIDH